METILAAEGIEELEGHLNIAQQTLPHFVQMAHCTS